MRQFFITRFREEHYPVTLRNGSQYMQSVLKLSRIRTRRLKTMSSPSTFEALSFLHSVLLFNTSNYTRTSNCSSTYRKWTVAGCTAQKFTKAWILIAWVTGMRPFSKMALPYFLFICCRILFDGFSRKEHGFALGL